MRLLLFIILLFSFHLAPAQNNDVFAKWHEVDNCQTDSCKLRVKNQLTRFYLEDDLEVAYKLIKDCLELGQKTKNQHGYTRALINEGTYLLYVGKYTSAIQKYQEAERLAIKHGFKKFRYYALSNVAIVYDRLNQFDQALATYKDVYQYDKSIGTLQDQFFGLTNIVQCQLTMGAFDEAKIYCDSLKILELAQLETRHYLAFAANRFAQLQMPDSAFAMFDQFLPFKKMSPTNLAFNATRWEASLCMDVKNYRRARAVLGDLIVDIEENKNIERQVYVFQLMAKIEFYLDNFETALAYSKKYKNAVEQSRYSIEAGDLQENLALHDKFQLQTKIMDSELAIDRQEKAQQQQFYFFIGVVVSVIVLGFLFYFLLRKQLRAKADILENQAVLQKQSNAILNSLNYAQRIQIATMSKYTWQNPAEFDFKVATYPENQVAGAGYWFFENENKYSLLLSDSGLEGVPGAFELLALNLRLENQQASLEEIIKAHEEMSRELVADAGAFCLIQFNLDEKTVDVKNHGFSLESEEALNGMVLRKISFANKNIATDINGTAEDTIAGNLIKGHIGLPSEEIWMWGEQRVA